MRNQYASKEGEDAPVTPWAPHAGWMHTSQIMQPCNELNAAMHYRDFQDIPVQDDWNPRTSLQSSMQGMTVSDFDVHEPPPMAMSWNYQPQYEYNAEYLPCIKTEDTGEDHTARSASEMNHPVSATHLTYTTPPGGHTRFNASDHTSSTHMLRVKTEVSAVSPQDSINTPISPNSTTSYLSSQTSSTCNHEHGEATEGESDYLQRVRRSYTTEVTAKYKCDVCSRLFRRGHNLKEHMQSHDPSRPHPHICEHADCDKRFVRAADLRRHRDSVHNRERRYPCPRCDKKFSRKDTARRHSEEGCTKKLVAEDKGRTLNVWFE